MAGHACVPRLSDITGTRLLATLKRAMCMRTAECSGRDTTVQALSFLDYFHSGVEVVEFNFQSQNRASLPVPHNVIQKFRPSLQA